jgi:zinc D-Ala-D-Ala carboxypeptidase
LNTRALAAALGLIFAVCGSPVSSAQPPGPSTPTPTDVAQPDIGPGAADTVGGWLPDGRTLSPFDISNPIVGWLDPALLNAIQNASKKAETAGIDIRINSGWRSRGFQQRLFDDGVRTYGSVEAAREFVASPDASKHVQGKAVDITPVEADRWLIANGPQFGLCQIYANELWHFELAVDSQGRCPPLKPNAAG